MADKPTNHDKRDKDKESDIDIEFLFVIALIVIFRFVCHDLNPPSAVSTGFADCSNSMKPLRVSLREWKLVYSLRIRGFGFFAGSE